MAQLPLTLMPQAPKAARANRDLGGPRTPVYGSSEYAAATQSAERDYRRDTATSRSKRQGGNFMKNVAREGLKIQQERMGAEGRRAEANASKDTLHY